MNENVSELILENKLEHDYWLEQRSALVVKLKTKKEHIKPRGRNLANKEDYDYEEQLSKWE